jgi:hypothetical protein
MDLSLGNEWIEVLLLIFPLGRVFDGAEMLAGLARRRRKWLCLLGK